MNDEKINIGKEIKKVAKAKFSKDIDFAKKMGKSRQNIYDLYKRETIDVNTLLDVCRVLSYNFFELYEKKLPFVKQFKELEQEPIEATLQIKLKRDKKDQVLKLVFGENNLEILNK